MNERSRASSTEETYENLISALRRTCTLGDRRTAFSLAQVYHSTAVFNLDKMARRPFATKSCFVAKVCGSS